MDRARVPLERMLEMAGRTVGQGDVGTPIIDDPPRSTRGSAATSPLPAQPLLLQRSHIHRVAMSMLRFM